MFPNLKLTNLTFFMKKWYNYYGVIRKVSDNMAMTKRPKRQYSSEIVNLEDMVPQDHFLRVIEKHFDWNFIYDEVEKLYSNVGRKSIDPVVLVKIHILKFLFHEDSLRKTYENLKYNNLYRWFIGYNLCEDVPDHSTYSQNYKRKFCKDRNNWNI